MNEEPNSYAKYLLKKNTGNTLKLTGGESPFALSKRHDDCIVGITLKENAVYSLKKLMHFIIQDSGRGRFFAWDKIMQERSFLKEKYQEKQYKHPLILNDMVIEDKIELSENIAVLYCD